MTHKRKSILGQAYSDGYREGLGQASQVEHDDAYEAGRKAGYQEAPLNQWFLVGAVIGSGMGFATAIIIQVWS